MSKDTFAFATSVAAAVAFALGALTTWLSGEPVGPLMGGALFAACSAFAALHASALAREDTDR